MEQKLSKLSLSFFLVFFLFLFFFVFVCLFVSLFSFKFYFCFLFIYIENSPCRGSKVSRDPGSRVGDVHHNCCFYSCCDC